GAWGLGGGIFNLNGSVSLVQATVADNVIRSGQSTRPEAPPASPEGGAVYSLSFGTDRITTTRPADPVAASLTLRNSILSGSSDGTNPVIDLVTQQHDGTHSLDRTAPNLVERSTLDPSGSESGTPVDFLTGDPGLGQLQDNGGPTRTHALLLGS